MTTDNKTPNDTAPVEPGITDESEPMPAEPAPGAEDVRNPSVSELLRRALYAGVGAVFMTEEGIRRTVSELKLPKEALAFVSAQAEKTRGEASRMIRKELRRFLNSEAFKQQLLQTLSGLTLEIKAEVRLKPDASGNPQPDVDAKARVKVKSPKDET